MKKCFLFLMIVFTMNSIGFAQYYYKDILSNRQVVADMAAYKENKIRSIDIKSFEADGSPSEGFFCQKKINKDFSKTDLFTRSDISGASQLTSAFNKDGLLLSTKDSSAISVSVNNYFYDTQNRIQSIKSSVRSNDDDFTNEILEEHIYYYNDNGQPEKMIRVKNNSDSTTIFFAADDNGNVAIEKDSKSGSKYYYYYNEKNQLTDIVESNDLKTRLIPDYLFEYNVLGQLSQMTTTEEGGGYYFVWKYVYENGLRSIERCYGKDRKLLGKVEYDYN